MDNSPLDKYKKEVTHILPDMQDGETKGINISAETTKMEAILIFQTGPLASQLRQPKQHLQLFRTLTVSKNTREREIYFGNTHMTCKGQITGAAKHGPHGHFRIHAAFRNRPRCDLTIADRDHLKRRDYTI